MGAECMSRKKQFEIEINETWFDDWEAYFGNIVDPRLQRNQLHPLIDVLMLALCAIISGAEGWTDVEKYGKTRESWLKQFLCLPNGIPSHDTIGRVFALIDPKQFEKCFMKWAKSISSEIEGLISVDGKCLRGSNNFGESPVNIVSAWSANNRIVIGQVKTEQKSNEITAIPDLIDSIDVAGSIISIDAAGCQKNIVEKIIERDADYLIALKGNQGTLHGEVEKFLTGLSDLNVYSKFSDTAETVGKAHGRIEKRSCTVFTQPSILPASRDWRDLRSIIMIESYRRINGSDQTDRRFYISSALKSAKEFLDLTREHWGIENRLHWVLDVAFREDQCRVRSGYAAQNFATLRHIALNLLKKDKSMKGGIKSKRLQVAWDPNRLLSLLGKI